MRALLYTATAFFIGLTGLFTFFALQPPLQEGGARIVLSIDTSSMPDVEAAASAPPAAGSFATAEEPSTAAPAEAAPQAYSEQSDRLISPVAEASADSKAEGLPLAGTMLNVESSNNAPNAQEDGPAPVKAAAAAPAPSNQRLASAQPVPQAAASVVPQPVAMDNTPKAAPAVQRTSAKSEDTLSSNLAALDTPYGEPHAEIAPPANAAVAPSNAATAVAVAPAPVVPAAPPLPARRPAQMPPLVKTAAVDGALTAPGALAATAPGATPAATGPVKQVRIAILIRGIGADSHDSRDAINKLPSAVSLGFMPSDDAKDWATQARDRGHEVIVQLPLEASDPNAAANAEAITSSAEPVQNMARLHSVLEQFEGPSGVTNIRGGKLLQSKEALRPILQDLKARGLIYIAEGNNSHVLVKQMARELNLRYGSASVILDTQPTPEAVKKSLERLVAIAQQKGSAIGIGSPAGVTVEELQAWTESLAAKGITLVPVGALAQTPGAS